MELEGVVRRERDREATGKVLWQRVTVVVEEERVVAKGRHGHTHLCKVVEVLHSRHLGGEGWKEGREGRREGGREGGNDKGIG